MGKTGVDIPGGENPVGAFWQPRLVIVDTSTWDLPPAFFTDGWGNRQNMPVSGIGGCLTCWNPARR